MAPMPSVASFSGATLEECSRLCINADSFLCKSFDYCGNNTLCILNNGTMSGVNPDPSAVKQTCSNYKREYFFTTSEADNQNKQETSTNQNQIKQDTDKGDNSKSKLSFWLFYYFKIKKY
jgi:hypothetical protein